MTDVKEPAMTEPGAPGLKPTLKTNTATNEAVRALTRELAVQLRRTPNHNDVIAAAVAVASMHMPLLVEYMKERP